MIASNISAIKASLPPDVELVAVSKFQSAEAIMEAYSAGQRHFGENRAQEFAKKYAQLPQDILWHFIGHLQTNKVKMVTGKASLIHSVDSEQLLWTIEEEAYKQSVRQECLLEIHIAEENSKSGFSTDEFYALTCKPDFRLLRSVKICGVMGMASFTDDEERIRTEFSRLKQCYDYFKQSVFAGDVDFCKLSMGMSGDYEIAVEEGSNMVRIGSKIFG